MPQPVEENPSSELLMVTVTRPVCTSSAMMSPLSPVKPRSRSHAQAGPAARAVGARRDVHAHLEGALTELGATLRDAAQVVGPRVTARGLEPHVAPLDGHDRGPRQPPLRDDISLPQVGQPAQAGPGAAFTAERPVGARRDVLADLPDAVLE